MENDIVESTKTKKYDISKSISANNDNKKQNIAVTPDVNYMFMWQYIERLISKFSDDEIDDLNYEFITLARNKRAAHVKDTK